MILPTGTVTFLFTDIEGSARLWEEHPVAMRLALERHDSLLKAAIEAHDGYVFKTVGDAFCAAFSTPAAAVEAALEAQLALQAQEAWAETGPILVRMGLHTGDAQERDNDYFGPTLNRVARLQGVGHGGQTLISQATYELVKSHLPPDAALSDLGLHRLKDLTAPEHVWQLIHPSLPQEFAPLHSLDYLPTNLPAQVTSFIGREKEREEIKAWLQKTRLLTLTGSGGCGKTRLALQAAAEVLERYADGVWLVELAALSDPSLVAQTVAQALGIQEAPGEPILKTLVSSLKNKQALLALDNCEHLLEASARLADALLKSCPKVSVLASSREALGIGGEYAYRVPSLSVPPHPSASSRLPGNTGGTSPRLQGEAGEALPESLLAYESTRLFIERAVSVKTDFAVTPKNMAALASVCHHLDGIPLAIELAAARVRALSVEEIDTRLDDRFRLLTGGSRTALPRHQTLRSLIDWSYDLLTEPERLLLGRLSVFADSWSLAAVEEVCAGGGIEAWEVLDLLTSLADKSLVAYVEREGQVRYRLLETVHQYAGERLEERRETEGVRNRHRDYFLALAEEAEPKLRGAEQAPWLQQMDAEHENLRAALDWSLSEGAGSAVGLRLCGALQEFWWTCGYLSEGREWSARALDKADARQRTRERANALNGAGILARMQGDYAAARTSLEESLAIHREIGNRGAIAAALGNLGMVATNQGEYASAKAYYEESLTMRRETGDRGGIGSALNNLGIDAYEQGDYATARTYYEESLVLFREIGHRQFLANALGNLGMVATAQGDRASARAYLEESLTIRREIGDRGGIGADLHNMGDFAQLQGDYALARSYYEESIALFRETGYRQFLANSLFGLGSVTSRQGDYALARTSLEEGLAIYQELGNQRDIANMAEAFATLAFGTGQLERAAALWGAVERLREETGSPLTADEREEREREAAVVRQALGEEAFSIAWAKGRAMTLEQAIACAREASI